MCEIISFKETDQRREIMWWSWKDWEITKTEGSCKDNSEQWEKVTNVTWNFHQETLSECGSLKSHRTSKPKVLCLSFFYLPTDATPLIPTRC